MTWDLITSTEEQEEEDEQIITNDSEMFVIN